MGNTINAALREPHAVVLADAVLPFDNLPVRAIEAYWRSFYDHAASFALTNAQLRYIISQAERAIDPYASSQVSVRHADSIFGILAQRSGGASLSDSVSTYSSATFEKDKMYHTVEPVMDALEFLSALAFIAAAPIEDKIELIFDSWDMSEDAALDVDEFTISLKSTLLGLAKVVRFDSTESGKGTNTTVSAGFLDDDEVEVLAERVFREVAKVAPTTTNLNQLSITCDQFRAYCMENKTARELFDLFDHAETTASAHENQVSNTNTLDWIVDSGWQDKAMIPNVTAVTRDALGADFHQSANDQGDEFLAIKPWKGAVVPPSKVPVTLNASAPAVSLGLEWIFGYSAQESKNNARYCPPRGNNTRCEEILYPAAGACVVLNLATNVQRHFLGHTDDIISICQHPSLPIAASGEIGKKPSIIVWHLHTMEVKCVIRGFHQRGILLLTFQSESILISIGGDDDHSIGIYESQDNWVSAKIKVSSKGNKAVPFHISPNAFVANAVSFSVCGDKYVEVWTFDSQKRSLTSKKALLGKKGTQQLFHVASYLSSGFGLLVVGTNDGSLYLFNGNQLRTVIAKAHRGAIYALHSHAGWLISGGRDGQIIVWDENLKQVAGPFQIKPVVTDVRPPYHTIRSCCVSSDKRTILVGTLASEIYEIDSRTGENVRNGAVVTGHFFGETWGLDAHPNKPQCCTVGDDQTLRIWDLETKTELRSVPLDLPARACAYSSDGHLIAVGLGADNKGKLRTRRPQKGFNGVQPMGGFLVFNAGDLVPLMEACYEPKKWVSDLKFSPGNRVLAVASHDTNIYFYDVLKGMKKKGSFKKHGSYVSHIDFSSDGLYLQSTCGAYELLFSEVMTGRHVTNASSLRDERWDTLTSTLGWSVQGIWEPCSDGTDVNSVDRSKSGLLLATGDDFGKVKIFRYPCALEKSSYAEFRGHVSHVTKVRWSNHDDFLLSVGGNDRCLFVWKHDKPELAHGYLEEGLTVRSKVSSDQPPRLSKEEDFSRPINDSRSDELFNHWGTVHAESIDNNIIGDEFMAVKPWIGAVVPPTNANAVKISSAAPHASLELDRVHGYQAQNASNNAHYDRNGWVVYHAAALGIVYDKATRRQTFFRQHDDDIIACCAHPDGTTFATAQMGRNPKICIWSSKHPSSSISCLEGFHRRFVSAVAFSTDGTKLGSVGGDDDHSIAIYSWQNGLLTSSAKGERNNVRGICFHSGQWITCGDRHVRFWKEQGKNLTSKKAIFGKVKHKGGKMPDGFECMVVIHSFAVVGASNGDLYVFESSNEVNKIVKGHSGALHALHASSSGNEMVSGGKDGVVMVWDSQLRCTRTFDLKIYASALDIFNPAIRSVCFTSASCSTVLIGTVGSDLFEVSLVESVALGPTSTPIVITRGHSQMEVWGLATHPTRAEYCTAGDDHTLRVWCLQKKIQLRATKLGAMARVCCIFADRSREVIAVGFGGRHAASSTRSRSNVVTKQAKIGSFVILSYSDLSKQLFEDYPSKQAISELKFSPTGSLLAVGSHDHNIYLYTIQDKEFQHVVKTATFAKHQSYITHLDFSVDGRTLQSNCGAYELLFCDTASGKQITSASRTRDTTWSSWTCVLGWPVQGIWPPCSDGTDVNAVDRSTQGNLLATSDDFGTVKLYQYPCVAKHANSVNHHGHSSHVTNVRWSAGDSHVISTGGNDRCIIEWKVVCESSKYDYDKGESKTRDAQDNVNDAPRVDEEYEQFAKEEFIEGSGIGDEPDGDEFMAVKPWLGAIVAPSNAPVANARAPDVQLTLHWAYGYQTELSQQNLMYNAKGEVVYHTAAIGVIYDADHHLQKHHVGHGDDILSLAISPCRNFVVTGERGRRPVIRIWDGHTGALQGELAGFHSRGVVSLAFSPCGGKLVSVGDDDDHSVALWEDKSHGSWTHPERIATASGDKGINRFAFFVGDLLDGKPDSSNSASGSNRSTSFVTGGMKHVVFWTVHGKTMKSRRGILGKQGSLQNFPSGCCFQGNDVVTGTASGELYVWRNGQLSKVIAAHDGESSAVYADTAISAGNVPGSARLLVSGGRDGKVILWNTSYQAVHKVDVMAVYPACLKPAIRSVSLSADGQRLLLGTAASDILEVDVKNGSMQRSGQPLVSGHFTMELWGLAVHPRLRQFVTAGDDATLRMWDMDSRRLVLTFRLPAKARACAYSPDGALLAIGFGGDNGDRRRRQRRAAGNQKVTRKGKDGGIFVLHTLDWKVVFEDSPGKEWISDIKFAPDGGLLAVGSHDNAIHLYRVSVPSVSGGSDEHYPGGGGVHFQKRPSFARHNSYITHFDFSHDGRYLQSNCGAYELLFCDTETGEQVKSASALKDVTWATWSCVLGWPVQGIWPECADGTDVNATHASASRKLLATGDDFGRVKVFRYPCTMKGAKAIEGRGHASHVMNVRFSHDDKFLLSVGGNDRTVLQWKLT